MDFFVYIIQSKSDSSYYKGFSENPLDRLLYHNAGKSNYTAKKLPWRIIYIEELSTKRDALIREKAIKKYSHSQIEGLILSPKNILFKFLTG